MKNRKLSIAFSEEQEQLLEVAINFCRDKSPVAQVRHLIEEEQGYDQTVWEEIVALGWLGIAVPEEFGGSGLGLGEVVAIAEPMGRHLMATPFASTTLACQALMVGGTDAQKTEWLPKICEGAVATLALSEAHGDWSLENINCTASQNGETVSLSGQKTFVGDAGVADLVIASVMLDGVPALVLLQKEQIGDDALARETIIDETRRTYRLSLDGISVPADQIMEVSKASATLERLHRVSCLLLSAEMCGGTQAALDYVIEYLNTRKQFGKFIGSYQALKHPVVDVLTGLEAARSFLYYAAGVFDDDEEGEIAVRMAKAQAGEVFSFAGDRAIQFHGGFGFTYDCDAQLYRRRALWCEHMHGDAQYHRDKLAERIL